MEDYYSILGIRQDSSLKEIKDNYQKLSRALHPDKQPAPLKKSAEKYFSRIEKAKDVLLNPAKKLAYDIYGETGVEVLQSSGSWHYKNGLELSDHQDRTILNEKLRKLVSDSNEISYRAQVNPRTQANLGLTCAEYIDFLDRKLEKPYANWQQKLKIEYFQLQQMIKVNVNSRIAGDLGFLVYTREGQGVAKLSPNISWDFGGGAHGKLAFQLGDLFSWSFTLSKTWQEV